MAIWCKSGVKYSELLLTAYFNIFRCHVIAPMHCVFLGLAKHTIKTWKDIQPQEKVTLIVSPFKIGRIPGKIECSFASFTADEWKNYSVFALYVWNH